MSQRADFYTSFLDAMKAMIGLEVEVGKLGLEPPLIELRASQINAMAINTISAWSRLGVGFRKMPLPKR